MRRLLLLFVLALTAAPLHAQSVADVGDHPVALQPPPPGAAGKAGVLVRASEAVLVPFTGVAFEGVADRPEGLEGSVRFDDGSGWGDWLPLYIVPSATDGFFMAAYRSDRVRAGVRFEVRLRAPRGGEVSLGGAAVFDNRFDADRLPQTDAQTFPFGGFDDGIVRPPALVARRAWNADPFRGTMSPLAGSAGYTTLTLHHAAGFGADNLADGKEQVKRIQDFHQNGRGWSDIGYQFVMDEAGNIYQGRPFLTGTETLADVPPLALGAHVGGANTGNIGVSLLGCYHPPEGSNCRDVLSPAAFDSVVAVFAFLAERYDVSPDRIFGHRDFSPTACPGNTNYVLMDELRARVRQLLEEGNRPVGQAVVSAEVLASGAVQLAWTFTEDNGIVAYRIERAYLGEVRDVAAGAQALPADFVDRDILYAAEATYRLYASDAEGRESLLATTTVAVPALGAAELGGAFDASGDVLLDWRFTEDNGITGYRLARVYRGDTVDVAVGDGAPAATATDEGLLWEGTATYLLYGRNGAGREALLATTEVVVEVPASYVLTESFPNPFAATATIRYALEREGHVLLEVFDAAGRRVATLVDAFQEPGRWHDAVLDGTALPSGLYHARLRVSGFSGVAYEASHALVHVR